MTDPTIEKRLAQLEQSYAELQKENAKLKWIVQEQQKILRILGENKKSLEVKEIAKKASKKSNQLGTPIKRLLELNCIRKVVEVNTNFSITCLANLFFQVNSVR